MIMMVKLPKGWGSTDKFEFTGKWKCGTIYDYRDADVYFEVKFTDNIFYRWWKNIPSTDWIDAANFIDVNVCDRTVKEPTCDWINRPIL